jgi:hypothetical protein
MSAEPPSSSGLPGRSRPQLSDLSRETTEDDLWNLDEEAPAIPVRPPNPAPAGTLPSPPEAPEAPGMAQPPVPRGMPQAVEPPLPRKERPAVKDEIGDLDESEPDDEVVTLVAPVEAEPAPAPSPAPEPVVEEPAPEPAAAADLAPPPTKGNKPRHAPAPKGTLPRPRLNRREVIGIAGFAFVLMIAALWVLSRFFTQLAFKDDPTAAPDYPLKGERVTVAAAETFWREPVREGDARDVARREVVMIPVLELSLDPENSPAGALRVIFRNGQGQPVGDPITRTFAVGRFEASGNATIAFPATDGFEKDGDFHAYRTGKGDPWTVELLEGPSADAPAGAFKKLAPIPILPLRR